MGAPDGVEDADVGGDGLVGVADDGDELGVGEGFEEGLDGPAGLGGFGEDGFVGAIGVELALKAAFVIGHQFSAFFRGQGVGEAGFPEFVDEGKEEEDGFGDEGVDEEAIVFFGLVEPHFVHVIPAAEPFAFCPGCQADEGFFERGVEASELVEHFLIADGGEDGLVHLGMNETFMVEVHEFLGEGGAAAGRRDDEDGLDDLLVAEGGEEDAIEQSADGDEQPHQGEDGGEGEDVGPSAESKGCAEECEILGFEEEFGIEIHCAVFLESRVGAQYSQVGFSTERDLRGSWRGGSGQTFVGRGLGRGVANGVGCGR